MSIIRDDDSPAEVIAAIIVFVLAALFAVWKHL